MGGSIDNEEILRESRKQMNAAIDIIMNKHSKLAEAVKKHHEEIEKPVPKPALTENKTFKKKTITEAVQNSSTIHMLLESLAAGPFKQMMQLQLKYMIDWGRMQGIAGTDEDIVNKVIAMPEWHEKIWLNILKHKHPELLSRKCN